MLAAAGCVSTSSNRTQATAPAQPRGTQVAPYFVALEGAVPACSRFGATERLVLRSGNRKDLKPALDYFIRTHDLSECWFVDIFTNEAALAEFIAETSDSASGSSDAAKQMLTANYVQLNNNAKTHERWYGVPVQRPNGRWEDVITDLRR